MDSDAAAYITAVETADGATLPTNIKNAIDAFVIGAKADGFWTALKACCFLAGPATLDGALVPLVGAAPTNSGPFDGDDYDQLTGLKSNGSGKHLVTNYNFTAATQNNRHGCVWASEPQTTGITTGIAYFGSSNASTNNIAHTQLLVLQATPDRISTRCSDLTTSTSTATRNAAGLIGIGRSGSANYQQFGNGGSETATVASAAETESTMLVFRRNNSASVLNTTARLAFYSFGEFVDLALLRARLTTYMAAIADGASGIIPILRQHYAAQGAR
jgi:hypothetical protein